MSALGPILVLFSRLAVQINRGTTILVTTKSFPKDYNFFLFFNSKTVINISLWKLCSLTL